ncbi:MAG: hypothetical protein JW924_12275 [Fusobacteriaceae bacterium]|nr:hypothetical protein [Fusobacteriaceae bacterium]
MDIKKIDDFEIVSESSIKVVKTKKQEYVNIDETLEELEKSTDIIRMEMNTIEYPLFSKDPKRVKNQIKVYNFKADGSAYLEVEAPYGYAIPGEFEERVFIGLTKIMKKNKYPKKFVCTINEVLESLNVTNWSYMPKIKNALRLLSKTNYTFKNILYSSEIKGIFETEKTERIMKVTIITRDNSKASEYEKFEDKRVKEIYVIEFEDIFYDNIVSKGYLAFDSEKLLAIENSVARSIYTMIEKWRGYNLYLKKQAFFIARRIPLKWEKKNIKRTIDIIEKALIDLKNMDLILTFNIIKKSKWELAEIEIIFDERHNEVKQKTFYDERQEFNVDMIVTSTQDKVKNEVETTEGTTKDILELFPERLHKVLEDLISEAINTYGFEYTKFNAVYTVNKKPKQYKAYFNKSLKENYAAELIANAKHKEELKVSKETKEIIEEAIIIPVLKFSYEEYLEKFEDSHKIEIENKVYEKFLNDSNSRDSKIFRGIFEKSKKGLITQYLNDNNIEPNMKKIEFEKQEISGIYISKSKFLVEVLKIAKDKNIEFDIKNVAPVFNELYEYEDEFLNINYDENTKIGIIKIL